jgi:hypothetical protein
MNEVGEDLFSTSRGEQLFSAETDSPPRSLHEQARAMIRTAVDEWLRAR